MQTLLMLPNTMPDHPMSSDHLHTTSILPCRPQPATMLQKAPSLLPNLQSRLPQFLLNLYSIECPLINLQTVLSRMCPSSNLQMGSEITTIKEVKIAPPYITLKHKMELCTSAKATPSNILSCQMVSQRMSQSNL
jgi:hypothetical protein